MPKHDLPCDPKRVSLQHEDANPQKRWLRKIICRFAALGRIGISHHELVLAHGETLIASAAGTRIILFLSDPLATATAQTTGSSRSVCTPAT